MTSVAASFRIPKDTVADIRQDTLALGCERNSQRLSQAEAEPGPEPLKSLKLSRIADLRTTVTSHISQRAIGLYTMLRQSEIWNSGCLMRFGFSKVFRQRGKGIASRAGAARGCAGATIP